MTNRETLIGDGPGSLSYALEFDHVVHISPTGVVTDSPPPSFYAPECYDPSPDSTDAGDGWTLITSGLTGQYGYSGPWLHDSELIEGGVARHILDHAREHGGGYYVAVYATYTCETCAGGGTVWADDEGLEEVDCPESCEPGGTIEGWAIAYHPADH